MFKNIVQVLLIISITVFLAVSLNLFNKSLKIKLLEVDNNRYEIYMSHSIGKFQYLLDKKTGRTWQLTQFTDIKGQPTVWRYLFRIDNEDQLIEFARLKEGL
jgi:hypothetical protein